MNIKTGSTKNVKVIETEVYSRVVGYYRPVRNWNKGKRNEFSQRKLIDSKPYNTISADFKKGLEKTRIQTSIA
ncbi:MAG: anaerobic ribonucleoside-triphosphate reductase [Myxococcota bacterium]